MSYDNKFDNFKENSPFTIELVSEPNDVQFREVKLSKERGGDGQKEVKINIVKLLQEKYPDNGQACDLVNEFQHSGPPNLMEVDNEYGLVYFALGKCLFALKGK